MDVLAVKQVTAYAKAYALEKGPIILELDTYRCVKMIKRIPESYSHKPSFN
jgi:TPP-dependent pyruvate/acetoin dehydrogenase alpha subunit